MGRRLAAEAQGTFWLVFAGCGSALLSAGLPGLGIGVVGIAFAFDIIFSVSVVEHVPTDGLPDFFADCHRILKPGGRMAHLIDLDLENADGDNARPRERCAGYVEAFREGLFQACGPMEIGPPETVVFRTDLVTNPGDMMNRWNRSVPQLRDKRERAQSCTLLMVGSK
jgi:SAM-dependent methyltransferase